MQGHCSGTVVQGVAMRGPEGPAEEAAACSPRTAQLLSDEENARRLQQEEDDAALAARMQASHDAALRQRLSHEHHARLSAYHADAGAMHRAGYYHSPMPVHHPVPGAVYVAANVGVRPVPPAAAYPRGDWYMEECAYCNWETQVVFTTDHSLSSAVAVRV